MAKAWKKALAILLTSLMSSGGKSTGNNSVESVHFQQLLPGLGDPNVAFVLLTIFVYIIACCNAGCVIGIDVDFDPLFPLPSC